MRLRDTRNILVLAAKDLELNHEIKSSSTYYLNNFIELKHSIQLIESTGLFSEIIKDLKNLDFYAAFESSVLLQNQQLSDLTSMINRLIKAVSDMITSLNSLIPPDTEYTISIKLPTPKSFLDLSQTTKSLDLIFNQTLLHPSVNGDIKILNFDMGSYWIDILINGGGTVMNFIAALAWGGAVTFKKYQEGLLVREQVRELKISNDAKEEIQKGLEESENTIALNEATFIANEFYKEFGNEDLERLKFALKELVKIYANKGEIHPGISASDKLKEEFPKMQQINTIESKIKQIAQRAEKKGKS
jgi:hypothetical protein